MDWDEVTTHLATAGLAHIATASVAGVPHAAVVSAVVDGETLAFFTRRSSGKARNLAANPHIAMMWQPRSEIYLQGDAELVADIAEKTRLWTSGLLPYDPVGFFGSPDDPNVVLVRVRPTRAVVLTAGADGPVRQTWHR